MTLAGRTALVTGAARGIGLAISERLLGDGARVVMLNPDATAVEGAAKRLGSDARAIVADVTRTADVDRAVQAAHDWHGRLDIVVNNAGITGRSFPTWELTDEDWSQVIAVDLTSVFAVCRAAVRLMRPRQSGRIVNIASIAGKEGNPTLVPYSTANVDGTVSGAALRAGDPDRRQRAPASRSGRLRSRRGRPRRCPGAPPRRPRAAASDPEAIAG